MLIEMYSYLVRKFFTLQTNNSGYLVNTVSFLTFPLFQSLHNYIF